MHWGIFFVTIVIFQFANSAIIGSNSRQIVKEINQAAGKTVACFDYGVFRGFINTCNKD